MVGLGVLTSSGFDYSFANGVSADGMSITGTASTEQGHEIFLWTALDGMVPLGSLEGKPYPTSYGLDISADGSVLVGYTDYGTQVARSFRWTAAAGMEDLGDLPGSGGNRVSSSLRRRLRRRGRCLRERAHRDDLGRDSRHAGAASRRCSIPDSHKRSRVGPSSTAPVSRRTTSRSPAQGSTRPGSTMLSSPSSALPPSFRFRRCPPGCSSPSRCCWPPAPWEGFESCAAAEPPALATAATSGKRARSTSSPTAT